MNIINYTDVQFITGYTLQVPKHINNIDSLVTSEVQASNYSQPTEQSNSVSLATELQAHDQPQNLSAKEYCKLKSVSQEMCLDRMLNKTVFVVAMSNNHYSESHNLFGAIQQWMLNPKIIVYDIGLTAQQVAEVSKICLVEVRPFRFDRYPEHVTPHTLTNYAWKPLLMREVTREYEIVVWTDTSIRFHASLKEYIFPFFLSTNLNVMGLPYRYPRCNIATYTHDGMIKYLNLTREELTRLPQIQSGLVIFWMNSDTVERIVHEWADCALHLDCISPKGAVKEVPNCSDYVKGPDITVFGGCHRYDQSALDLILYKHHGKGLYEKFRPVVNRTCTAKRHDVGTDLKITYC